jgi:hypothetical protein
VPISHRRVDEIRQRLGEHRPGEFMAVLRRRVLFQRAEGAALAAPFWWTEYDA